MCVFARVVEARACPITVHGSCGTKSRKQRLLKVTLPGTDLACVDNMSGFTYILFVKEKVPTPDNEKPKLVSTELK